MGNTEPASSLFLILSPVLGMVAHAVITGLPLSTDTVQTFYEYFHHKT